MNTNKLKECLLTLPELAEECGITVEELWEIILGGQTLDPEVARKLALHTGIEQTNFYKEFKRTRQGFLDWMAERAGLNRQHFWRVIKGKNHAGRKAARALSQLTGIGTDVWMFPDEHENWMRDLLNKKIEK